MSNATVAPAATPSSDGSPEDAIWVIISAFIIFTMQSGFGLLESGMVSRKNEANVIVKNMLDVALGGVAFWFFGFGLGFGPNTHGTNRMSGASNYFFWNLIDVDKEGMTYAQLFFQMSFATTATTIVSGAVAERVNLKAYIIFAVINTGLVYPLPAHWMWGGGWASQEGGLDFAGSAVVHMSGGAAAFVASAMLGPRHKRYGNDKLTYYMASPTNVVLGTFFLWWGWIGFNCGSTFGMTGGLWKIASRTAVVTMNGAMGGGIAAVITSAAMEHRRKYFLDIPQFVSGILGGLVSITAPAAVIEPWEGLLIGFIGGFVALGCIGLVNVMRVDDPVGCVGVHWGAGLWAMIATGFFANTDKIQGGDEGIFRGGSGKMLGMNIAFSLAVTLWSGGLTALQFLVLKYTLGIRMPLEDEILGSDQVEHNIVEDTELVSERNHSLGRHVVRADTLSKEMELKQDIRKRNTGNEVVKNGNVDVI